MSRAALRSNPLPPLQKIVIYRAGDCWMADHRLDPSAPDVYAAFGGYALPLPFTAAADEARVRRSLETGNPGVQIIRAQDVSR